MPLRRSKDEQEALEEAYTRAKARIEEMLEREAAQRTAELEHSLTLARSESIALLAAEERRIAEERRRDVAEREDRATAELGQHVVDVQHKVEKRLAEWAADLERLQETLGGQIAALEERQRQLVAECEARIAVDAERLEATSEELHGALGKLRADVTQATKEAISGTSDELEAHAAERRRALHEVGDRLRRRERELNDLIDREQTEAVRRVQATLEDVERRQLEQLKRAVDREAERFAEAAAQQFEAAIKTAREDAAKRLARELDRAVAVFSREADSVLGERLSQVAEAGVQHLEKRLRQIAAGLERQRDEFVATLEKRLSDAETMLRERVEAVTAESRIERDVLDARLRELSTRIDEAASRARSRLAAYE